MASKTVCCGMIVLLFILLVVLLVFADIYNTSYQRSPEVREAHGNLEEAISHAKDSTTNTITPIMIENTNTKNNCQKLKITT